MDNRIVGAVIGSLLFTGGCGMEDTPGAMPPDNDQPVSEIPSESDSYPYSLCGNQLDALQNKAPPPSLFPLELSLEAGEVRLLNGDFEGVGASAAAVTYNRDPMYVYSGEGSASLNEQPFRAYLTSDEDYYSWQMSRLTLWLYSASAEAVDFLISAEGMELQRISSSQPGFGYSGVGTSASEIVTVEPHVWVELDLDLEGAGPCVMDIFEVMPTTDAPVEYYIDDIQLLANPEQL